MNKSRRAFFSLLGAAPLGVVATVAKVSKPDDRIMINPWSSGGLLEPQMVRVEDIDFAELVGADGEPLWVNVYLKHPLNKTDLASIKYAFRLVNSNVTVLTVKVERPCISSELSSNQDIMKLWRQLNAAGVTCVAVT